MTPSLSSLSTIAALPVLLCALGGYVNAQALDEASAQPGGTTLVRVSPQGTVPVADPGVDLATRAGTRRTAGSASDSAALRIDNYVDVVDSVLNARVRARRTEIVRPPALGAEAAFPRITRVVLPVHLPLVPLEVSTTAAFTGAGAPAGAASWPPAAGQLSITAADGSRIELDADTGDIASVNVTVVSGTRHYVFREDWATWAPYVLGGR